MSFSFGNNATNSNGVGSTGNSAFGSAGGSFGGAPGVKGGDQTNPFSAGLKPGGFGAANISQIPQASGTQGDTTNPPSRWHSWANDGGVFGVQPAANDFFGAPPVPTNGFGISNKTSGSTGSAFGGGVATGTSAFTTNTTASPFAIPKPTNASPFSQPSGFGAMRTFTRGFTTVSGATPSGDGGTFDGMTGTSAFDVKDPSPFAPRKKMGAFGAPSATTGGFAGFSASPASVQSTQSQVGTGNPPYQVTREQDGEGGSVNSYSISRMPAYTHKSSEELRYEDHIKRTDPAKAQTIATQNPPQTNAAGGFGTPSGFGSGLSAFGSQGGFTSFKTPAATPATNPFAVPAPTRHGFFGGFGPFTSGFAFTFGQPGAGVTPPSMNGNAVLTEGGAFGTPNGFAGGFSFGKPITQSAVPASGGIFGQNTGAAFPVGGPPSKTSCSLPTNFRTEELQGYLLKKSYGGKWEWRWFETNGSSLKYYKTQGNKLRAELNLLQAGTIALKDGSEEFSIELNGCLYTLKAKSPAEATFWVEALTWRKGGGVFTHRNSDIACADPISSALNSLSLDEQNSTTKTSSTNTTKANESGRGGPPKLAFSFGVAVTGVTHSSTSGVSGVGVATAGTTGGSGTTGTTRGFSFGVPTTKPVAFEQKKSDDTQSTGGSYFSSAGTTATDFGFSFGQSTSTPVPPSGFVFGENTTGFTEPRTRFGTGATRGFGPPAATQTASSTPISGVFTTNASNKTVFGPNIATATGDTYSSTMKTVFSFGAGAGSTTTTRMSSNNSSQRKSVLVGGGGDALPTTQELLETCRQRFQSLPFLWAIRIRLHHPWSGTPMLVGKTSLPESVENEMFDKLAFLRPLRHGAKRKAGTGTPFAGINYLRSVAEKQPFEEADLFTALELLEVLKTTTRDAEAKLQQYVNQSQQCHPLMLLAMARLVSRSKVILRVQAEELIELFQALYPEAAKLWLSGSEQKLLADKNASGKLKTGTKNSANVKEQWEKLKKDQKCTSTAMDDLMKMAGLARVKRSAITMFKSALAFQQMTSEQRKKNARAMNYCFVGNPGTGKTSVAKLFARILHDSGMRRTSNVLLRGAQELKSNGADKFRDEIKSAMGGVVFIDEAYELDPSSDPKGKAIVAEILIAAEEHRHDLSMILAGYKDDIEQKLYAYNDGVRSRFTEVMFEDFDESDLRVIWDGLLKEREWKCDDKVSKIACRRLARGAGKKGFGNARAVRQLFEHAAGEAMTREDFRGVLELRAVDVIGDRPSKNPKLDALVRELDTKIGWKRVKEQVKELIDICDVNYERELNGRDPVPVVMNRLFLGNPGTGKTTCAALYGRLLKLLGFLSNGEVVKKTAGDFLGEFVGQSQTKTNEILKLATGKLLIIDEAYNLDGSSFGKQVLDVLVEKIQGSDTDDIAVILIGYEHQMTEMLRKQNPGLVRRFPIEYAFYFEDYEDHELFEIFSSACEHHNVDCPLDVAEEVIRILSMQRRQPNFGNAGAVEMLLKNAIANALKRPVQLGHMHILLQVEDLENEMSKRAHDLGNDKTREPEDPLQALDTLCRMDNIKQELQRLRTRFKVAEEEGEERPEIGHFVFRGSPGTGKTTVARTMGKILHHMGLLSSDRVVETSGLNLTGEYVGHTKKKVEEQLSQARGAILFIDEAYELGKGHYGEEAMTTLVAAMTDPTYDGMVIIIAGYPADMDVMFDRNAGLKSRFTRFLEFPDWETSDCISFLQSRSTREKYAMAEDATDKLRELFDAIRMLPGFGNGRDVDKVWKCILECRAQRVVGRPELERTITLEDVEAASHRVLAAREPPKAKRLSRPDMTGFEHLQLDSSTSESLQVQSAADVTTKQEKETGTVSTVHEKADELDDSTKDDDVNRDPGVLDAVWEELEQAKQAYKQLLQDMRDADDKKHEEAHRKAEAYQAAQSKLRRLGKCPAGYEWRQVGGGWRCAGGSHFVTDAMLENLEKSL